MSPEIITSTANPRFKNLLQLQKRSERTSRNLILIEGWREIRQAFASGVKLKTIYLSQEKSSGSFLEGALSFSVEVVILSSRLIEKAAYRDNTEGVLAVGEPFYPSLESVRLDKNPLIFVIESVEKPGNLGAIMRTAEAAAVDCVFVCDPLTDIYNPNVIRSSLGCVFAVPVVTCDSAEAIRFLHENKINIFAATLTGDLRYDLADFTTPSAIVMGTEATGLSGLWQKAAHHGVLIPMLGQHDSLNVSVAAAILIFEARRQRSFVVPVRYSK